MSQADFGTGQKKLGVYVFGVISCIILTVVAFWAVMTKTFGLHETFIIIYSAAIIQFLVQVICFLRLNAQTEQARTNVLSILFTLIILVCIVSGSMWIMWNLNYNMMH